MISPCTSRLESARFYRRLYVRKRKLLTHSRAPKLLYPRVPACSFGRGSKVCVPNSRGYHCWCNVPTSTIETRNHRKALCFTFAFGWCNTYVCFDVCQRCSWIVLDRTTQNIPESTGSLVLSSPKDETTHTSTLMQRKNGKTLLLVYVTKFCFFFCHFSASCSSLASNSRLCRLVCV